MSARICPTPAPDCGLYFQRLSAHNGEESLRRAILTERSRRPDLADLITGDSSSASQPKAALPEASKLRPSVFDYLKGVPRS